MSLLYPYQRRYLQDKGRFKAGMFARQTGKTFTTTLEAVIDCLEGEASGHPRKWTILSVSEPRAKDALDDGVKLHLNAFKTAFQELEVELPSSEKSFEIRLPGGSRIRAIAAKPSTARGMSENLILDEFAHHADNRAIWTALFPVISRKDLKLRVISTPNGKGDKFYEIMTDPGMGFSTHITDIYQAVADGLPRDIEELKRGLNDPEAWAQEFECQFVDASTAWLTYDLIANGEDAAAGEPDNYTGGPCFVGMDFARRGDLTVIVVLEQLGDVLWLREMVELPRTSFAAQLAELDRVMQSYRVVRAALDQTGMGEMPVEEAIRRHGSYRIEGVLFTGPRKLEMAGALKQRLEDSQLRIPISPTLRHDLHSVTRTIGPSGAPRLGADRKDGSHADRFWALGLACAAAYTDAPWDLSLIQTTSALNALDKRSGWTVPGKVKYRGY
ncbi:MAG: terminase [Candidatus Sericytochromatia bacterium]|nr:terminase [Candidatus Sericytochromatia bacterium]